MSNLHLYTDRNPGVVAAGKTYPVDEDGVKTSLVSNDMNDDPFVGHRQPRSTDAVIDANARFGKKAFTGNVESASNVLRPAVKTRFQDFMDERKPTTRPHGTTDFDKTAMFGVTSQYNSSVSECMQSDSDLLVEPGVQHRRGYATFDQNKMFGAPTPNDPSGSMVKATLVWQQAGTNGTRIVSTKTNSRLKGKERIDPVTTERFGLTLSDDGETSASLLHAQRKEQDRVLKQTEIAKKLRPEIMISQFLIFHSFKSLRDAFEEGDVDESGSLDQEEFRSVLLNMGLELPSNLLDATFAICDRNGDGQIDYNEFLALADNSKPLPCDVDMVEQSRTKSKWMDDANAFAQEGHAFGMMSIRTDRAPPTMQSISDKQNYGDPTTTGSLITPSPLMMFGFTTNELSVKRPKHEILRIFRAVYPQLDDATAEALWEEAAHGALDGEASINDYEAVIGDAL